MRQGEGSYNMQQARGVEAGLQDKGVRMRQG